MVLPYDATTLQNQAAETMSQFMIIMAASSIVAGIAGDTLLLFQRVILHAESVATLHDGVSAQFLANMRAIVHQCAPDEKPALSQHMVLLRKMVTRVAAKSNRCRTQNIVVGQKCLEHVAEPRPQVKAFERWAQLACVYPPTVKP